MRGAESSQVTLDPELAWYQVAATSSAGGGAMVAHFHHRVGERRAHDHSITWPARRSTDGGIVSPSALAVLSRVEDWRVTP